MPAPRLQDFESRPQLPTISAPGGLPFLAGGGAPSPANGTVTVRKADIVTGGRGGGPQSGGEFDPGSGGDSNG